VYPEQEDQKEWGHVKFAFRSSLLTAITLKDHFIENHWIIANNLIFATRQSFSIFHPIRRLLKPHVFQTFSVNSTAQNVLFPINGVGFKLFALHEDSCNHAIADCLQMCKF